MPPHRHVFTGGSDSVRGFRDGTLGPRDSLGNPYGGDAGVVGAVRSHHPAAAKFQSSARVSLFYDIGQSYYLGDTEFRNKRGDRTDYRFDLGELRSSAGIAVQWLSPMGLFRFSCAMPLRYQDADASRVRRRARSNSSFQSAKRSDANNGVNGMRIRNGCILGLVSLSALALNACGGSDEESGEDPKIRLLNLSAGYTALDLMTNLDPTTTTTTRPRRRAWRSKR